MDIQLAFKFGCGHSTGSAFGLSSHESSLEIPPVSFNTARLPYVEEFEIILPCGAFSFLNLFSNASQAICST
jgi:hypothetical protein